MNAIALLKQDHRRVRELFSTHEGAGERALVEKQTIAEKIFDELDVHTQIEEEIFYPATRDGATGETDKLIAEAYEEHQVAKGLISELRAATPGDEQWDAKMKVLQEAIEHHVEEEEGELFPKARATLGTTYLTELGGKMAARKQELTSPSASLSGSLVKMVSRAYDSLTGNGEKPKRSRRSKTTSTKRAAARRTRTRTAAKSKRRGARKTATAAANRTRRAARRVVKKAASSRAVRATKKSAARGKSRAATVRARATKMAKTARKRAGKVRRSARR